VSPPGGGRDWAILGGISVAATCLLGWFSTRRHFSGDELYSVYAMTRPVGRIIADSATLGEPIPPGYYLVLQAWNRFLVHVHGLPVPESLLLLPSVLSVGLAVFLTGLAARRLLGPGWPACAVALVCGSSLTWTTCGLYLRYYSFQFAAGALVVLLYVRLHGPPGESARQRRALVLGLALAMAWCAFMGYSALVWLFGLFVVDLAGVVVSRRGLPRLWPYLIAAIVYAPWLATMGVAIHRHGLGRDLGSFWPQRPGWRSIWDVYTQLLASVPLTVAYVIAVCVVIVASIMGRSRTDAAEALPRAEWCPRSIALRFIVCPLIMVLMVFVYSRFIAPEGSIFVGRYFYVMWPMLCVTIVVAAQMIWRWLMSRAPRTATIGVGALAGIVLAYQVGGWFMGMANQPSPSAEPYFEEARYLREASDVGTAGVAVVCTHSVPVAEGWQYYYVTEQGTSDGFTFLSANNELPTGTEKVYFCAPHTPGSDDFTDVPGFVLDQELPDLKIRIYVAGPPDGGTSGE
jgi:hypothetical protein